MTQRHSKAQQAFNLQSGPLWLNGRASTSAPVADYSDVEERASVTQSTGMGKIEVSPRAIAHIASRAAQRSYGIVGLASRHARPGLAELLRREEEHKGVEVKFSEGHVIVDLYVIIEYGTRISEVARNIMSNVRFAVESALGVPVVYVNVNIQGIRVSNQAG
jgi:uncharacterized alkaline shock family protein YloU